MAKFDLMGVKRQLDHEKAARDKGVTTGEKVVKVGVTAFGLVIFYSFLSTYHFSTAINMAVLVIFIALTLWRAYRVFNWKK